MTVLNNLNDEVNTMCADVAKSILASSSDTIVDAKLRGFVQQLAQEKLENFARRGTPGTDHCYFCGARVVRSVRCSCAYSSAFGCDVRSICEECASAHKAVGRHLDKMFSLPVVWRSNSRRRRMELMLVDAAFAACNPTENTNYNPNKSQDLAYWLLQADSLDEIPADQLRSRTLDAFRKSRFLDFKALAMALEREKDREILRDLARTISRTFNQHAMNEKGLRQASDESEAFYR